MIIESLPSCYFQHHVITTIFEEVASENPEKLALVSRRGTLSYAGLNERANQLSRHLSSLGIGSECIVAVALERGIEYVIAMFASWKIGATYLPLDKSLPAKRMQYMMTDSGASSLITVNKIIEKKNLKLNRKGKITRLDRKVRFRGSVEYHQPD